MAPIGQVNFWTLQLAVDLLCQPQAVAEKVFYTDLIVSSKCHRNQYHVIRLLAAVNRKYLLNILCHEYIDAIVTYT